MFQLSNIYTRMFISDIHKTMRTTKPTQESSLESPWTVELWSTIDGQ